MPHAVLGEQQRHHLAAAGASVHRDGLVLDVRTKALGEHADGGLQRKGIIGGQRELAFGVAFINFFTFTA